MRRQYSFSPITRWYLFCISSLSQLVPWTISMATTPSTAYLLVYHYRVSLRYERQILVWYLLHTSGPPWRFQRTFILLIKFPIMRCGTKCVLSRPALLRPWSKTRLRHNPSSRISHFEHSRLRLGYREFLDYLLARYVVRCWLWFGLRWFMVRSYGSTQLSKPVSVYIL